MEIGVERNHQQYKSQNQQCTDRFIQLGGLVFWNLSGAMLLIIMEQDMLKRVMRYCLIV